MHDDWYISIRKGIGDNLSVYSLSWETIPSMPWSETSAFYSILCVSVQIKSHCEKIHRQDITRVRNETRSVFIAKAANMKRREVGCATAILFFFKRWRRQRYQKYLRGMTKLQIRSSWPGPTKSESGKLIRRNLHFNKLHQVFLMHTKAWELLEQRG